MGPCLFLIEHFFCLFHHKTRWTMSVDNVGLKICMLGTLDSMVTLTFFVGENNPLEDMRLRASSHGVPSPNF
jgi:hypothetical protein